MHIVRSEFDAPAEDGLAFAKARGFGLVLAVEQGAPVSSHLPFHLDLDAGVIGLHVTYANPLATLADGRDFLIVVAGDDAYVSNDWYASPDQVSTWLYESVHITGSASLRTPASNRAHGDDLLDTCEARLAPKAPWSLDRMEPTKREAMLNRIHFIEIAIGRVQFQRKLNQFKPDHDHVAVANALALHGNEAGRRIGEAMRALRPGLDYDGKTAG